MIRTFLCTAPSANNFAIPDSRIWIDNLQRGLQELGVQVILPSFDTHRHMEACLGNINGVDPQEARALYSSLLLDDVKIAHSNQGLDLYIGYLWSIHILPEAIRQIGKLGIPTVLFFCNAAHQFHHVEEIAPFFDYCMVPEEQALKKYRSVGANPLHIQMAADPDFYRPVVGTQQYDVSFVGQKYLNRGDYIAYLAWHDIDVQVWGPGWWQLRTYVDNLPLHRKFRRRFGNIKRKAQREFGINPTSYPLPYDSFGPILTDQEMVAVHSLSRIALNFSEVVDEITGQVKRHIRLRDFEIPMSGGLMFTGYQSELRTYYEIGKEIVCYDDEQELLDKCIYYLVHEDEAKKIRLAGHQRARRDHTWANRFRQLFLHIGLLPPKSIGSTESKGPQH